MSFKIKFIILLVAMILIIGSIFGIFTVYRFFIIEKIKISLNSNIKKENYYLKTYTTYDNQTSITETYYKDGIGKLIAENGVYTWTDGKSVYVIDDSNATVYVGNFNDTVGLVSNETFAKIYPTYTYSIIKKLIFAGNIKNKIKNVMLNDEKCIMIEVNEESFKKTVWISKNTYSLRKAKLEFPNGEVLDYEYELRFNYVKTRDVSLPDITKYKFLDSINTINKDNNNETSTNSVDNSQVVSPANFQTNN